MPHLQLSSTTEESGKRNEVETPCGPIDTGAFSVVVWRSSHDARFLCTLKGIKFNKENEGNFLILYFICIFI